MEVSRNEKGRVVRAVNGDVGGLEHKGRAVRAEYGGKGWLRAARTMGVRRVGGPACARPTHALWLRVG
jgi:hypothetical protein